MNAEHTALVARLDRTDCHHCKDAAAAIIALAGEVERLKLHYKGVPHDWVAESIYDDVVAERDTLRAEVSANRKDAERAQYCEDHALALDFDYGERHECVLVIRLDPDKRYPTSFRRAIDAALADKPLSGPTP